MGRRPPKRLSEVGTRISDRASKLGIDCAAIAAAAGISPSTLYRSMRAGTGATTSRLLRTKRSLARVLRLPMVQLFNEAQLEILDEPNPPKRIGPTPLERLVLHQLRTTKVQLRERAAKAAAYALVDVILSVSNN